jgi:hypothetical protein
MSSLSAQDLIRIWETGLGQHPIDRALTILSFALPARSRAELAEMRIGQRDAHLLALRQQTFGSHLNGGATCPSCENQLEFSFAVEDIRIPGETNDAPRVFQLSAEGYEVEYRLPDSFDLATIAECADVSRARVVLASRCILSARHAADAAAVPFEDLPGGVLTRVEAEMAERDSQAEVRLDLDCPECGHRWQMPFDIALFFWLEISARARRLLREVDLLARTYCWREEDILSMSAIRRQFYLEMVM